MPRHRGRSDPITAADDAAAVRPTVPERLLGSGARPRSSARQASFLPSAVPARRDREQSGSRDRAPRTHTSRGPVSLPEQAVVPGSVSFTGQVGAGQVGAGQVGAGQVGAGQVGAGQVGAGQIGAGQVGAGAERVRGRTVPAVLTLTRCR
jgi:hypothetical protein